jgi:hypothetical protein
MPHMGEQALELPHWAGARQIETGGSIMNEKVPLARQKSFPFTSRFVNIGANRVDYIDEGQILSNLGHSRNSIDFENADPFSSAVPFWERAKWPNRPYRTHDR